MLFSLLDTEEGDVAALEPEAKAWPVGAAESHHVVAALQRGYFLSAHAKTHGIVSRSVEPSTVTSESWCQAATAPSGSALASMIFFMK